jgi:signal-transduction protein with cAMP-binding, CBS, and nucleotidyltransferase domain
VSISVRAARLSFGQQPPPPEGFTEARFEATLEAMAATLERMLRERDYRATFQLTYLTFSRQVLQALLVHVAERLERRTFERGELLVRMGQPSGGVFLIESGEVDVVQRRGDDPVHIAARSARDAVGELSALNDTVCTADCRARSHVECYFIPKAELVRLLHVHPRLSIGLIRMLSQRLVATTLRINASS